MSIEAPARTLQFGRFQINTSERLLKEQGEVKRLFPQTIATLLLFLESDGRVLTKEELINAIWGETHVEGESALNRQISHLRKALGDDSKEPKFVETIPTRGYRWVCEVQVVPSDPALSGSQPPSPILVRWIAAGGVVVSLAFAAIYSRPEKTQSVVVVPFQNLSADRDQDYFAAGLTEAVLTTMGRIEKLKVISHPGSKAGTEGPAEIAKALGADFALTGAALRQGDRQQITAHLLAARTGQQIWADQFEGGVQDALESQAAISRRIADVIRLKLTPGDQARLAATRKVVPDAYIEYLKGRYHWNKRTKEDFGKAMGHFQAAIAADPTWAPPYAGEADAFLLLGSLSYDVLPPRDAMPKARAAAAAALKLDDANAEAHTSMGYYLMRYEWKMAAAEKEFQRALALNSGYANAHHWYAHLLLVTGRVNEALSEMHRAQERDPLSISINDGLGWALYLVHRYDEAIVQYRNALEMDDQFLITHCMLGMAYEQKRMEGEAIAEFQRALSISPDNPLALCRLGHAYAVFGKREEAFRIERRLEELSKARYVPAAYPAAIFDGLGDNDRAFAWAEKALEERSDFLIYLNVDPSLDHFRTDLRYPALAQRIGLRP
jgi:TolB-like protein/DNA-binding winged helix-turn-helix (wHTH) protein/Tfp pilus assembly protein PilF